MKNSIKALIAVLLLITGLSIDGYLKQDENETRAVIQLNEAVAKPSPLAERIVKDAARHDSPEPVRIALAIERTSRPTVIAAISKKESGYNPAAKGSYGEVGMTQIIPRDWGHPGFTPESQAKKTDEVIDKLVKESRGDLRVALRKYHRGPDWKSRTAGKYADSVLAYANRI